MNNASHNITLPNGVFSRAELGEAARHCGIEDAQLRNLIADLEAEGRLVHLGRDRYASADAERRSVWAPTPTAAGEPAKRILSERFPLLDWRIWELAWLNEFLGHLIGRNAVLACAEGGGEEFVFDELNEQMPARVLYKPSADDYLRYGSDGCVVVLRLVSESPRIRTGPGVAPLEQIIVDLFAEKLVRSLLSPADYPAMLAEMFARYRVDEAAMFRYARRRGKEDEVRRFLAEEAGVKLFGREG